MDERLDERTAFEGGPYKSFRDASEIEERSFDCVAQRAKMRREKKAGPLRSGMTRR